MLVQIIRFSGVALILTSLGCSGGNFTDNKKTASTERDSGEGDSETADEPVMVGGAYLSCFLVKDGAVSSANNIGCAVKLKSNNKKASLLGLASQWSLSDKNGAPVSVGTSDGSNINDYHKMFSYPDDSYKDHSLELALTDAQNRKMVYRRNLSPLDVREPSVPASFRVSALFTPENGSKDSSSNSPGGISCISGQESANCLQEAVAWAGFIATQMNKDKKCKNGSVQKSAIENTFGSHSVELINEVVSFNAGSGVPCIYNHGNIKPSQEDGCFIVPVNLGKGKYQEYFISSQSGISLEELDAMSTKYQCLL